jgi:hypothetical protein
MVLTNSVLSIHAQMFFFILVLIVQEKINIKFLLASLKIRTNSRNCSKEAIGKLEQAP